MKNTKFNSKRYILAIDDLLELIKGAEKQLAAHRKAAQPSELMLDQYNELRSRYKEELSNLMIELNQEVQQLAANA
jgi:dsDNA-specific endonuclease/ATPase MutS2